MKAPHPSGPLWPGRRPTPGRRLAGLALRLLGWRATLTAPPGPRLIVVVYPHTSNWDFPIGMLWAWATGAPVRFVAKKELFGPPFGALLRAWGGLPVDRRVAGGNFVQAVTGIIRLASEIALVVTPEGSRSRGEYWKSGFYHMAQGAGVPIGLAFIDWAHREVGLGAYLTPTGDLEADFERLRVFYAGRRGLRPRSETPIVPRRRD